MAHRSTQLCCVSDFPWFSRASNECSYGMGEKTSTHSHSQHFAASYSAACSRKMLTKSSLDFKVSRLVASRRVLIWRLQKGFSRTKAIECDNGFWDRLFFFFFVGSHHVFRPCASDIGSVRISTMVVGLGIVMMFYVVSAPAAVGACE